MTRVAEIFPIDRAIPVIPANVDAEAALLGALLISNELIGRTAQLLAPDDFIDPLHARVFAAIVARFEKGQAASAPLLRPEFENDPDMQAAGGVVYLARLTADGSGLIAHGELIEQIADLAERRGLMERMCEAGSALLDYDRPVADILSFVAPPDGLRRPGGLRASPFVWRDEADIPRRRWLYGSHLIRKFLSLDIAAGGLGKSSVKVVEALALASGRDLLGKQVHAGPHRVWLYNLEDPDEETERRLHAAAKHFEILPIELDGRLFVNSGREQPIVIAEETPAGARIVRPVADAVIDQLRAARIDVLMLDPFVSSHAVCENDNRAIDLVAKEWSRIAEICDCSINLVHHIRKANGTEATAESSRGAVSLIGAARSVIVYNRMTKEEGERAGIAPEKRGFYFRTQIDKANLAPPEAADWFRMNEVEIANGDRVGVACPWAWPDSFEGGTTWHLKETQRRVSEGRWRKDVQSAQWVGVLVAEVCSLDSTTDRPRVKDIIKQWVDRDMLRYVEGEDENRRNRIFAEVGTWHTD